LSTAVTGSASAIAVPLRNAQATVPSCSAAKPGRRSLWMWRAVQLADAIGRGKVSSREAIEAAVGAMTPIDPSGARVA